MSLIGRENVYTCPECSGYTVTIDVDEGVTPMFLNCRATAGCKGMAHSAMYPEGQRPPWIPAPTFEWFKPVGEDYEKLSAAMKDHVDSDGLDLRPRAEKERDA